MSDEIEGVRASRVEYVGPFEVTHVVIDGWRVPYLQVHPQNGGVIGLTLDNRFGIDIEVAQAETLLPFIADCIAVALGYTAHPRPSEGLAEPLLRTLYSRMISIVTATSAASEGTET